MIVKSAAFDGDPVQVFTMVYAVEGNKVLVLQRRKDKVFLPGQLMAVGGKVEPGEDIFDSARREFIEETGLTVEKIRYRGTYTYVGAGAKNPAGVIHLFLVDAWKGVFNPDVPDGKLMWLTLDEVMAHPGMDDDNKRSLYMAVASSDFIACIAGWNDGKMVEWADSYAYYAMRRQREAA